MGNKAAKLGAMLHVTPQQTQNATETYHEFTQLVIELDETGFDEAWVTEHHFNPFSLTPSPLLLMSHFLAHTQQIKLGTAAVLVGFHNPIDIAEQLATLHNLYPHRVSCGFAKGGPFESQNAIFKTEKNLSRARMLEAVPAMLELFAGEKVSHQGEHYHWQNVALCPKASLGADDLYLASADEKSIDVAAKYGLGLMAAQFWPLEKIFHLIKRYQSIRSSGAFMAARGVFIAEHADDARHQAWSHIQDFRAQKSQLWGREKGPMAGVESDDLLSRMLLGRPKDIIAQVEAALATGINHLALNPLTSCADERHDQLLQFKQEVWTRVVK